MRGIELRGNAPRGNDLRVIETQPERLLSMGGKIMTPRRNRLTDEHFETVLLLRANKDFC